MSQHIDDLVDRFEKLVRRDPANRGLIGQDGSGPGSGELLPAARLFREPAGVVGIVTGFFIPHRVPSGVDTGSTCPPALSVSDFSALGSAETDGPPGAAVLASVLAELGFTPRMITDEACLPVVAEAVSAVGLSPDVVSACPVERNSGDQWVSRFAQKDGAAEMTHLVAIERVGPSHHRDSIRLNDPQAALSGEFERQVSEAQFDRCFNMRGEPIDQFTAALHMLFPDCRCSDQSTGNLPSSESVDESPETPGRRVATVGIGDGGNEIGMGRFTWSVLRDRLSRTSTAHIPCRIATDQAIVAGTSNLGAFALAAAIAVLHERIEVLAPHTCDAQLSMLKQLVDRAGAVDGVTRAPEPTVDGVPFLTGIQPWAAIRRELGLRE